MSSFLTQAAFRLAITSLSTANCVLGFMFMTSGKASMLVSTPKATVGSR
jgi:hypothetical protein